MRNLILKKCNSCGALVKVIDDCNCKCDIECCGEKMQIVNPNSEGDLKKHEPIIKIEDDQIIVNIDHVMEDTHYIKWIALVSNDQEIFKYLSSKDKPEVRFDYVQDSIIYAYCNKHGLWNKKIK